MTPRSNDIYHCFWTDKKKKPLIKNWNKKIGVSQRKLIDNIKWEYATQLSVFIEEHGVSCGGAVYDFELTKVVYAPGSDTHVTEFSVKNKARAAARECPQTGEVPCYTDFVVSMGQTNGYDIAGGFCDLSATVPPDWE